MACFKPKYIQIYIVQSLFMFTHLVRRICPWVMACAMDVYVKLWSNNHTIWVESDGGKGYPGRSKKEEKREKREREKIREGSN